MTRNKKNKTRSSKSRANKNKKTLTKPEITKMTMQAFEKHPKQTFNYKQMASILGLQRITLQKALLEIMNHLANQDFLTETSRGKFKLQQKRKQLIGIVDTTRSGDAYIILDNDTPGDGKAIKDIFVAKAKLNGAMNKDVVRVRTIPRGSGKSPDGEVIEVVERNRTSFVGRIEMCKDFAFLITDKHVTNQDIFISKEKLHGAKDGQLAIAKVTEWPKGDKKPYGEIIEILGDTGNNNAEMHAILSEYDLPYSYPQKVVDAANEIPDKISNDEIKKRRDFRDICTFTIDPKDAKDFDDAISIQKLDNGNWQVGVHIADVTYYVTPNSIIDKEGYSRATSVYLVDRVVPMLPERLSNGLCSLRPNEDKLCFSAVFELDDNAKMLNSWIGRTIIHSNRRFTYEEAQEIIEGAEGDYKSEMLTLNGLAQKLRKRRFQQGAISFERSEMRFELDENGKPISVYNKVSKEAHKLVEEFMLLANKRVAEFVALKEVNKGKGDSSKTFVYRIHDNPDPEKFANFANFARKFGYQINSSDEQKGNAISKEINKLLKDVNGKNEQNILETLAVRTMAKASYSTHNIGHYGLAFKHYSHFTSPIRRYPDMMVHRLLQQYIDGEKSANAETVEEQCKHCSKMEILASEAERASIKYKQVEFMKDFVGEQFNGVISGVTEWGIYVALDDNNCEGMISLRSITDDHYYFDAENYCVVGHNKGNRFQLGESLRIQVAKADLIKKQLDFELIAKTVK